MIHNYYNLLGMLDATGIVLQIVPVNARDKI